MTELEKLEFSQPLTDIYTDMEHDLMVEIARRLAISREIIPSDKWRLQKLAEAGELNKKVVEIIAKYTGKQSEQLTETITAAANSVLEKLEPSFRELAKEGYISSTSVPISKTEKQVVKTFRKQAATDLNLVNTVMRYKAKQAYVDLVNKSFDEVQKVADASNRQEILNTLGKHTLSVATGAESSQAAVRKCIQEFNRKGIPAFIDAAGRNWSPEAYVSMDIRTTVSNTAHAAVDARCDAYGIDLIAIDSHTGSRPKCALDQGKVYSRSNQSGIAHDGDGNEVPFYPLSSTSYGQPDGILGINCRHHKYPFIDGVNYQRYFPIDQEKNAARYKEIQEQRRLERRVRETRREIDMLTAAGDADGVAEAKIRLTERNKEYREYCDKHKLKQQYDRTRIVKSSDKGVTAPKIVDKGNSGVDKAGESGIIKAKKYDFLNGVSGIENISEADTKTLDEIVSVIPEKHLTAIEKNVKKVTVVQNRGYCSYDTVNKELILDPDKMNGSIIHEYGHVLADAYNIYEDNKFLQILKGKFDSLDWKDMLWIERPKENDYVYFLKSDKLMDGYQGRVYVDLIDIDYTTQIPLKSFQEYFSVGFDTYFKNPDLIKAKDPELFEYIKELLANERF